MDSAMQEKLKEIEIKMESAIEGQMKTTVELAQKEMETKLNSAIQEVTKTKVELAQKEIEKKMDSAIQEQIKATVVLAQKEIETKLDSAIQEVIKTKVELAQKEIEKKMDSAIQEQIKTTVVLAQKKIETKLDSAIQEQIKTTVELAQKDIETKMELAIQEHIKTKVELAQKDIETKMESAIQVLQEQIKRTMQTVTTSVVIVLLGTAVAVYWNLGSNRNEKMTILPNGSIVVPDKVFMENVTLSLQLLKDELLQYQNKFQELQTTVTKVTDSLLYVRRDVKILEGQVEIPTSKTIFSDTVFIHLFGLAVEVLIFILLIKYLLRNRATADTDTVGYSEIPQPSSSKLLEQVKQVPLDRSVCIVSFHEETQKLHMDLAKSAIQTDIPVKQFLMKEPETQLMSIPCSKFILVFVDYSERNIILETPGKDLGDKKVVTVHAAQKMGADVFVVYVRDRGSTTLPDGVLYNTILASFTRNPTLKKLTVKDRGLSVYETFNDYQKSHINKIIS